MPKLNSDKSLLKRREMFFLVNIIIILAYIQIVSSTETNSSDIVNNSIMPNISIDNNIQSNTDMNPIDKDSSEYLYYIQRIIENNPGYFNYSESNIIQSENYFLDKIRKIYQNGDNFSSFDRTILLYRGTECNDGVDSDGDGLIDERDPGCWADITDPKSYSPFMDNEERATASCLQDSDCGEDRFSGNKYCIYDDVYRNYAIFECINKGRGNSGCVKKTSPKMLGQCPYGCKNGFCIQNIKTSVYKTNESIIGTNTVELNSLEKNISSKSYSKDLILNLLIQLIIGISLEFFLIFLIFRMMFLKR